MTQFQTFTAQLVRSELLSEFTKHLEFEVEGMPSFGFVPGQWLSVKAQTPEGEEITRAYSMASAPSDGQIAFCLNRVQDGFMSNYLCDLAEGEKISFQGPFGDFILRQPLRDTLFIATGTGIAPFRAMLQILFGLPANGNSVERAGTPVAPHQFWLLFGSRSEKDIYYRGEFEHMAATRQNFHFVPTLSRGGAGWNGLRGYVQEHVREIVGDRKDMQAYICGRDKMVTANRELLKSLGWDRKSIRYEKYD